MKTLFVLILFAAGCHGDWTLSDNGFGPIIAGMTPDQANTAVNGTLVLTDYVPPAECGYARLRGRDGIAFMIERGKVVRIDVRGEGVRTAEGAGVGDTEERIQELYRGRVQTTPHKYTEGHSLTVLPTDTAGHPYRLIFETDGEVVKQMRGGMLPQVAWVEGCS